MARAASAAICPWLRRKPAASGVVMFMTTVTGGAAVAGARLAVGAERLHLARRQHRLAAPQHGRQLVRRQAGDAAGMEAGCGREDRGIQGAGPRRLDPRHPALVEEAGEQAAGAGQQAAALGTSSPRLLSPLPSSAPASGAVIAWRTASRVRSARMLSVSEPNSTLPVVTKATSASSMVAKAWVVAASAADAASVEAST